MVTGKDFDENGTLTNADVVRLDEAGAIALAERLRDAPFAVRSVEEKPDKQRPSAPFITSTLQQEASRKLRFGSQRTMQVAQRLYENGYITYMRTDSTTLSDTALTAARAQARQLYGDEYVPDEPRRYEKKVKNAQEAHEAIRPAGDTFRLPDEVARELPPDEAAPLRADLEAHDRVADGRRAAAPGPGAPGRDVERLARTPSSRRAARSSCSRASCGPTSRAPTTPTPSSRTARSTCRRWRSATRVNVVELEPKGHATKPPARFTEASLVKRLEELGVGRPSTYASIIGTIQDRGYVLKKGSALVPTWTAFAVVGLLEQHFGKLVDYGFTARMEDDLDEIAAGERAARAVAARVSTSATATTRAEGPGVEHGSGEIDAREINSIPIGRRHRRPRRPLRAVPPAR